MSNRDNGYEYDDSRDTASDPRDRDRFGEEIHRQPVQRPAAGGGSEFWGMLLIAQILAATGAMVFVLPQFKEIFMGMRVELPLITQLLLASSDFMVYWWFVALPAVIAICGAIAAAGASQRTARDASIAFMAANAAAFLGIVFCVLAVFMPMVKIVNAVD